MVIRALPRFGAFAGAKRAADGPRNARTPGPTAPRVATGLLARDPLPSLTPGVVTRLLAHRPYLASCCASPDPSSWDRATRRALRIAAVKRLSEHGRRVETGARTERPFCILSRANPRRAFHRSRAQLPAWRCRTEAPAVDEPTGIVETDRPGVDGPQTGHATTCSGHYPNTTTTSCGLGLTAPPSKRTVRGSLDRCRPA